ncbi:hypothetical protein AB1Y20_001269 [Prymnesium parvum]|uniref:Peroxisomal membrane protein PEX16 n=1 Tax=Prymnesium parvum TaxID=97485 RepID=A0AB34K7V3_PRYPA
MRAIATLWGLESLTQEVVPLLALLAFVTTAAELPEARTMANEIATHWEALTTEAQQWVDGVKLLKVVEQLLGVMLPAAAATAAIAAAEPAQILDAVGAALYLGEVLQRSVGDIRFPTRPIRRAPRPRHSSRGPATGTGGESGAEASSMLDGMRGRDELDAQGREAGTHQETGRV